MAGSLNKVVLIGNVGKDPEIRNMPDGKEVSSFSIATSEYWRDKATGEKREATEWHRISVFSEGLIGIVKKYVKKGSKVYIEGTLRTRKWVDQSTGQDKNYAEVILQGYNSQLILLDGKTSDFTDNQENTGKDKSFDNSFNHSELDDEIPF